MAGKGGGAWKVAYADFVTAMMAFFMVMWLTAQKPEVKQAVAGYFRDPYAIFLGKESGAAADAHPAEDPKLGHNARSQRRRVSNAGDDTNYQFPVPFAEDSAELDAAAIEAIRSFAPTIVGKLNRVDVRAHCQSKPLPEGSPFATRWDLCYARARAVQEELEKLGVEPERFRVSLAEANEPVADSLTEAELKLNSRVEVMLLADLINAPWQPSGTDGEEAAVPAAPEAEPTPDEHGAEAGHAPTDAAHAVEPHDAHADDHGGH
jgi:chemotaxis protein MotB